MTVHRIEANVPWKIQRAQSGNWVGVCEPLRLTVQSETWGDLMEDIAHTLDAVLKDVLSNNELPRFLHEQGWQHLGPLPTQPDDIRFDVPFSPARANGPSRELH